MARPLRIQQAGLAYHITGRGNGRMTIFEDDVDRREFLDRIAEVFGRAHVTCISFCLMDNHYHVVVRLAEPNLSATVQRVNGPYGQWWNHRRGRVGHVFQGRFWAKIIQDGEYLLTACAYVALNPVRVNQVREPEDWPWSSYRATAGLASAPGFLQPEEVWRRLGAAAVADGGERFRACVRRVQETGAVLPRGPIVGDEKFLETFVEFQRQASQEVARRERSPRPPLQELFRDAIRRSARNARIVMAYDNGYSVSEIGRFLDLHYSGVSKILQSCRRGPRTPDGPDAAPAPETTLGR